MKRALALCLFALIAAAAVPASGSIFVAMDRAELIAASQAVVVGHVTDVRSFWNDDATAILTEAVVRVDETVAGDAPRFVTVRTFGGTVGSLRIEAHGFPTFREGQRTLLFLDGVGGTAEVVGYQQGQFRIVTRVSDGMDVAIPALDGGATLVRMDGSRAERPRAMPLSALVESIRETAGELRSGRDQAYRAIR